MNRMLISAAHKSSGGPHFCSMRITQDVRDYARAHHLSEQEALEKGMEEKSEEFLKSGSEIYQKA